MSDRRRYGAEEKLRYTKLFFKKEYSYNEMSELHGIPKTTMFRWVELYKAEGEKGFNKEHKGNSNGSRPKATPKFNAKRNENVTEELERLRAEVAYLKKLNALVQERQSREKRLK